MALKELVVEPVSPPRQGEDREVVHGPWSGKAGQVLRLGPAEVVLLLLSEGQEFEVRMPAGMTKPVPGKPL